MLSLKRQSLETYCTVHSSQSLHLAALRLGSLEKGFRCGWSMLDILQCPVNCNDCAACIVGADLPICHHHIDSEASKDWTQTLIKRSYRLSNDCLQLNSLSCIHEFYFWKRSSTLSLARTGTGLPLEVIAVCLRRKILKMVLLQALMRVLA